MAVLEQLDVAAAAGFMEGAAAVPPPPWMDPPFVFALRNVLVWR